MANLMRSFLFQNIMKECNMCTMRKLSIV